MSTPERAPAGSSSRSRYPAVQATSERIWRTPHVRELYPVYLTTMHGVVRSAVPLIEAAIDALPELRARRRARRAPDRRTSSTTRPKRPATTSGCSRTSRRSAATRRGARRGAVRRTSRRSSARSTTGSATSHPGLAARPHGGDGGLLADGRVRRPPAGADRLPAPTAFRAVRRHERLDVKHKRELYETIDALPLTAEHERLMGLSGLHTMQAAVDVFAQVLDAPRPRGRARYA